MQRATWLVAVAGTVAVGVVSLLAHEYLPAGPDLVGNSAALWLAFAFYLGARSTGRAEAVLAGLYGLIGVVLVYYGSLRVLLGRGDFPEVEKVWFLAAVVAGPLYGGLGHLYRSRRAVLSGLAAAALGAAFVTEAVNYRRLGNEGWALGVEAAVGLVLPLVIARGRRHAFAALAWLPLVLLPGLAAFRAVDALLWRVS